MSRMKPSKYSKRPSFFWKQKYFHTEEEMTRWIQWRQGSYDVIEIAVPTGFAVKYRKNKNFTK